MNFYGPSRKNNIYWYVEGRVVVPLMSPVVLVNFEVGCWTICRRAKRCTSLGKYQKAKNWQELLIFICSLWENSNTVGVFFFLFSPSHHPSLHECTVPYCCPGNFSKGVRWEENRQKEKDGDKKMKTFFSVLKEQKVQCFGFQEQKASTAVNSRLLAWLFVGVRLVYKHLWHYCLCCVIIGWIKCHTKFFLQYYIQHGNWKQPYRMFSLILWPNKRGF